MKKGTILFIHGGEAYSDYEKYLDHLKTVPIEDPFGRDESQKKWKETLKDEFEGLYDVLMPSMPNRQNSYYLEWKIWFERYIEFLQGDVILIGHSQGGYFLAKYLSENRLLKRIKRVYLLAAPFEPDNFKGEDGGDFQFDHNKLANITAQSEHIVVFHSKDDPIVPYKHAQKYKAALPEIELIMFENKGHFILEEFPELIKHIKKTLKNTPLAIVDK